ncbi:MAG: caspase family protein [Saprospiraceae bacterium]
MSNIVDHFSATSSSSVYTLLVGIDVYPNPLNRLGGCRNDVTAMQAFLAGYLTDKELQVRLLIDEQATKANIIEALLEMQVAKAGDTCLFYFSGHGSQGDTLPCFQHLDFNGKLESIVCYDSRLPGGFDLLDKELSQLSWALTFDRQTNQDKGIHLVMIFDCCHAGGNTKEIVLADDQEDKERAISNGRIPAKVSDFYGYQFFDRREENGEYFYTPKRGPHIQLAAAKGSEKAKERWLDGKKRGLYTYHLLEVLRQYQANLSYTELHHSLGIRLGNDHAGQTPQADFSTVAGAAQMPFLWLSQNNPATAYVINYQTELKHWIVNIGHIHGLDPRQASQTAFYLPALGQSLSLSRVYLSHSVLNGMPQVDQNMVFRAYLQHINRAIEIGIDKNAPYFEYFQSNSSPYFSFVQIEDSAEYAIQTTVGCFTISKEHPSKLLYTAPQGLTQAQANQTLLHLEKIVRWHFIKAIKNERSYIKDQHFQLDIWRQEGADAFPSEEEAPKEKIETWEEGIAFRYQWGQHYRRQQLEWLEPAIRLTFTNTSGKTLYIAGLYFQADYKITDRFCELTEVPPGMSYDFQYRTQKGRLYKSIFLSIYEEMRQKGINQITEYLKLFISYQAFDVQSLLQEGLYTELSVKEKGIGGAKGIGTKEDLIFGGERDWRVVDVAIVVEAAGAS